MKMKNIMIRILMLAMVLSLTLALASCDINALLNNKAAEEEVPAPYLEDLEDAKDNLEDEGYDVIFYDEAEDLDPGEDKYLEAWDSDHEEYRLKVWEYDDKELANLYYEKLKEEHEVALATLKNQIEMAEYIIDEYEDDLYDEDLEEWEDTLDETEDELKSAEKYVVGIDGYFVWYGHTDVIEDSKG